MKSIFKKKLTGFNLKGMGLFPPKKRGNVLVRRERLLGNRFKYLGKPLGIGNTVRKVVCRERCLQSLRSGLANRFTVSSKT